MRRSRLNHVHPGRLRNALAITALGLVAATLPSAAFSAAAASSGYSVSLIPAGKQPGVVAVDPATDTVFLASNQGNQLSVINGESGTVTTTINLAGQPVSIAVDSATDTLYVSERSGSAGRVEVIDGLTNAVTASIAEPAGTLPVGIAVDETTNTVYVADFGAASLTIIDGASNVITGTISTGSGTRPAGVAVDESSQVLWVTNTIGTVIAISATTDSIKGSVSLGTSEPVSVAVDAATDTVYVTDVRNRDVAVIDGSTTTLTTTIAAGAALYGVAVDPATDTVYATSYGQTLGTTWVIDGASNAVTDTLSRGGLSVAVDPSSGIAYEGAYTRQNGAWVITPANADATSPIITSNLAATFTAGQEGSFTIQPNALPAATVTETGTLPSGITLNPDGTLAGTPAAAAGGIYPITITASNGVAPDATQAYTLTVNQPAVITSPSSTTFTVGSANSLPLTATGFPPVVIFGETGPLPLGVGFTVSPCCSLSGDPAAGSGGVYPITLEAIDAGNVLRATQAFTFTVNEAPSFASVATATFRTGVAGSFTVAAHGFPAPSFTETGALPFGVSLSPSGTLAGRPGAQAGGAYPITITASNGIAPAATQAFTLTVDQAPAFTSPGRATFRAGHQNTFTLRTTGFPAATLSESGRLPAGITFKAGRNGTAVLAGRPHYADRGKTFEITIYASNGVGPRQQQTLTLRIT